MIYIESANKPEAGYAYAEISPVLALISSEIAIAKAARTLQQRCFGAPPLLLNRT